LQVKYLIFWVRREAGAGDFADLNADEAMSNTAMPATVGRVIGDWPRGAASGTVGNLFV
jgi:hypothetical protein